VDRCFSSLYTVSKQTHPRNAWNEALYIFQKLQSFLPSTHTTLKGTNASSGSICPLDEVLPDLEYAKMLPQRGPITEFSILNSHPITIEGPRLLHELVPKSSDTNALAIDFLEDGSRRRTLTYGELHARSDALANRIAKTLARLNVSSTIIPVLLPQSVELYIALLAILKAGNAFCPIGLDTPTQRLKFILEDVSASLVITDIAQEHCLPPLTDVEVLLMSHILPDTNFASSTTTFTGKPAHLAYVLYTSGSTGIPKAVSVSHRAVTQSLLAHHRHIPIFSRFLQFAAPTFDVSIFEIFFSLYRGCTLVGCGRSQLLNDLPGVIHALKVDAAELTPTVVSNLLRGRKSVPGLKLLLTIGEMLTRSVIDEFGGYESADSILWGMYGPTEAAIHCTLQPSFAKSALPSNIGFPLDTVSIFIAAPSLENNSGSNIEILPFGDIGELIVGGSQVADEYLNRPELSAKSFIKHSEYGVLYRTGDRARLCPDGTIECLGRIVAGQVKLRGQRVELGEIEQIILSVNACHSAAVMVIEDTLVAFCATENGHVSNTTIMNACKRWLPSHMVPADVVLLRQMPHLSSGKTDKATLEAQYQRGGNQMGPLSTRSGTENDSFIIHTVQETLSRNVPLDAELGPLGVDSLRAIRIASSLRAEGYEVSATDILLATTLESLIVMCKRAKNSHIEPSRYPNINADLAQKIPELQSFQSEITDLIHCTPLQEAMLVKTNIKPSAYCNWIEVEMNRPQSFQQIQKSIQELTQRNEILRSGFLHTTVGSLSFVQVVWKRLPISAIKEVSQFSRAYSLGSVGSLLRPFAVQVLLNSRRPRLLFQIHHALYDGWSFDLILQDLSRLAANKNIYTRPQYREVVGYYLQLQNSQDLAQNRVYWTENLRDYHPKALPNFNGKVICSSGLRSTRGRLSVNPRPLIGCANEYAISPQVFFQTAVAYIMSLYHGSPDVVIGTVTSGRTIPITNVENVIGPCIASVPFRMNTTDCIHIRDLLHKTQRANRDMLQHCTLALRDIAKICNIRPGEHLFEVLFVWQQSHFSGSGQPLDITPIDSADDLEFKLTLEFEPHDDSILYRVTYDPSILPESQIRYLVRQIDQVVDHFVTNMDGKLEDVAKCFGMDLGSVANPAPQLEPAQYGPAYAVEKWALEIPNMDALVVGAMIDGIMRVKEKLTYASLNFRANRLARALIEQGFCKDQLVGILMEKSANLYVSILAVLKIGCGYLPIAPNTPRDRINMILVDAEVTLCISDSRNSVLQLKSLTVLALDQLDLSPYSGHNLSIPYNGSHLAYAIFTSGSTGKPKGVLVTQDNLMSNITYLSTLYPTSNNSRMLQFCSQAFDVSVFEIFFSWHVGMCICTAPMSDILYSFEAAINRLGVTHLSLTPTVAGLVDPNKVPRVKFLVTAGEALTENVKRKWAGKGLFQGALGAAVGKHNY
jgi:amino acid adenylation domain-containing protein